MSCVRHLALVLICIYLLLTSQKSNEVNWKAIKSIPWAVHDLPNWHDLKSKLISKLRQNTVSSCLVRNSECLFLIFLLPSCFNLVISHCFHMLSWLLNVSKFRQWKLIITRLFIRRFGEVPNITRINWIQPNWKDVTPNSHCAYVEK